MSPFQEDLIFRGANILRNVHDDGINRSSRKMGQRRQTAERGDADAFGVAVVDEVLRFVDYVWVDLDLQVRLKGGFLSARVVEECSLD